MISSTPITTSPLRTSPSTPAEAAVVAREGAGTLRRAHGFNVLNLQGSFYEMGYQHGALLRHEVAAGPIPYYRQFVEKLMGSTVGPLSPYFWPVLQRLVGRRVEGRLPGFAQDTIRGIADGAGLRHQDVLDGCTMPDSLLWLAARMMQLKQPGPAVAHRLSLGLGCTSAIAWGDATRDGRLLHARNFDYHGVGCWPDHATLLFHQPDHGHRYVSVAAAGVGLGGITAMNDAGLSLSVHQHMFTDRTRLGGTPIGIAGDVVMREASNLDDAERILAEHRPIGCWTYLVTDARQREVLCWEENPDRHVAIRRGADDDDSTFGYANVYLDPELGATEVDLYRSYWRHNQGRHRRVRERLAEDAGSLDVRGMADIIGDTGDSDCRIRESIAMVLTVASCVFRPEDGVVWVGKGQAPTSHGDFVPFDLRTMGHAPEHGSFGVGPDPETPHARAFELFRQAYIAYIDERDLERAFELLDEARCLAPDQALYHWLTGMMALLGDRPEEATRAFTRALDVGHPDAERVGAMHLWRARAHDLSGRRRDAERDYRLALAHPADPPVVAAAKRGLRRVWKRSDAASTQVDMALADVVSP